MTALTKPLKHDSRPPAQISTLSASAAAARPAWGWRWRSLWRSRRAFARVVLLASRPARRLDGSRAVLPRRVRSTP